jgi:hypothetical protein
MIKRLGGPVSIFQCQNGYSMDDKKTAVTDIIQKKWSEGFGLHVQGYVYGTGRVLLCDYKKTKSGNSLSTSVSIAGEFT